MNTKLLKQKILDLAIRGKLTQQLKSDGTAADLLKEIADAKSALSQPKGKKSKDSVQITPLDKNEAPFEIPANWEWIRLGDVCFVTKLAGFEYSDYIVNNLVEDGIPLFKGKNIQDSKLVLQFESYIPENISDSLERSQLRRKCILTPYVGTIGNMAIFDGSFKAHLGSNVGKIEPFNGILEEFLFHFLKSDIGYKQLTKHKKATAQESISIESIRDVFLPLPPLAEQQRIVKKIQEAFAEIDSIENNKELLKTHIKQARQKILDLAIHGKLVPQNKADEPASVLLERITRDNPHYEKLIDIPFEIPESWEWVKLGDVCSFFGGGTPDKSNPKYWNGSINWASVKDIKGIELTDTVDKITEAGFEDSASSYAEKEDLILVTRINPGMCIQTKIKTAINQDLKVVKVPSQINKVYVMVFCNYAQKWFLEKSSGTTVKGIKIDAVLQMPFPLPPLAEQKRIVDRIEEIFKSLDEISLHLV